MGLSPMIWLRTRAASALLLGIIALAGCVHSRVVQQEDPPQENVSTLVVGDVIADDANHEREVRLFRRLLIERLRRTGAFERVLTAPLQPLPPDAVTLTSHVHRIGDGSEALRFLAGFAGAPRLRVRLAIHDAAGSRLAAFVEEAHNPDGTGYAAHWSPVYLDDVIADVAERAAADVVRWRQGKPVDPGLLDYAFYDERFGLSGLFGRLDPAGWKVFDAATWSFLP